VHKEKGRITGSDICFFSKLTRQLEDRLHHVPCLGHVINLAVQEILGPSGLNAWAPENNDIYDMANEDEEDTAVEVTVSPQTALAKLRKGIVKIRYYTCIFYCFNCYYKTLYSPFHAMCYCIPCIGPHHKGLRNLPVSVRWRIANHSS